MIFSKFAEDIEIIPRFSKLLAGILIILHSSMALVLLIPLSLASEIKGGILIALIINLLYNIRVHVLLINCTLCGAIFHNDSLWLKTGKKAELINSYVHPLLIIIKAKTQDNKTHTLILLPDSLDKITLRRMRVRLRHILKEDD